MQEYVVWQIEENRIDWFVLEDGDYLTLSSDEEGRLTSRVFPGLVLDVDALLDDVAPVLDCVQDQVGGNEHRAFVNRLQEIGDR